jgi:hypothetical protein
MEGMHLKALFWAKNLESQMEAIADAILGSEKQFSCFSLASPRSLRWRGAFPRHSDQQSLSLRVRFFLLELQLKSNIFSDFFLSI